jgi:hypothetical protein
MLSKKALRLAEAKVQDAVFVKYDLTPQDFQKADQLYKIF